MSLFTIEPPQQKISQPRAKKQVARRRLIALSGAAVLAFGAGGVAMHFFAWPGSSSDAPATVTVAPTPPPADVEAGACVDSSGSVIREDNAPRRALHTFGGVLKSWPSVTGQVKRTVASSPQGALQLSIRLVEDNSYVTGADASRVGVRIPAYPGLSGDLPSTNQPQYATKMAAYERLVTQARTAQAEQVREANRATAALRALERRKSTGSDILGCVAGLAEATKAPRILVVSDLADTRLTETDGSPRNFPPFLRNAEVTIIQACPTGSPAGCAKARRSFERGLERMGLPTQALTVVRSEQTEDAVKAWVGALREASLAPHS
jgi:hypothetical protein